MPVYEYLCGDCGPFTDFRPMAECDDPQDCPHCASSAPRVMLTAPAFFCMPSDKRKAHATNEQSRNGPKTMAQYKPSRLVKKSATGAKSFPTARPWMISH
ncbi:MAG: zinc ribbon domain-containing protein [Hyphomicrobiales bacterium]|nr:zinc ribbon domain-containing protein [Hyphomicrobiales bacterium]